mmetsp:Transcript_8673/g.39435  ORF Transcript_8673/g.39435 Transcript_8673/m.39435 type:complete len:223 (-) Transcript_8673:2537-3205(-)
MTFVSTGIFTGFPPRTPICMCTLCAPGCGDSNVTASCCEAPGRMDPKSGSQENDGCFALKFSSSRYTASNRPTFFSVQCLVATSPAAIVSKSSACSLKRSLGSPYSAVHRTDRDVLPPTTSMVRVAKFSVDVGPPAAVHEGDHVIRTGCMPFPGTAPRAGSTLYTHPGGMRHWYSAAYMFGLVTTSVSVTVSSQFSGTNLNLSSEALRSSCTGTTSARTSKV